MRNATEALNLVAYSWGRANIGPGDLVVTTGMEHHANLVPWQQLAAATGATLAHVAITDDGRLDLDDLDRHLARGPKLLTLAHVSNALGTINPVAEITRARPRRRRAGRPGRRAERPAHAGRRRQRSASTSRRCRGHKMLGPSGIGALWGRRELLDAMPPFLTGGSMITRVTLETAEWNEVPWKFEAGTPAIAEADRPRGGGRLPRADRHGQRPGARAGAVRVRLARARRDRRPAPARPGVVRRACRRDQLRRRRHPSARPGRDPRPPRHRRPRRPSLRPAGDAALRPAGHDPRQLQRLQRPRRRRRA